MELDQLRTFLTVLGHGSFSRAAGALKLGQSTVSFHVKALETAAGAQLLDRHGGRVRATAAGKLLQRYALKLVALRDEALARLRAEESAGSGRLRIAASTVPAEYLLPPILAAFRRAHPRVGLELAVSDSRRAVAALVAEECDLALVGARTRSERVVYAPFADDELVLVAAQPSRLAPSGKLAPTELGRLPLITREEGSGTAAAVAKLVARAGAREAAPIEVGSTEAARRCVLEGMGLAFLSRHAVAEDLHARRLQIVKLPGTPVARTFWVARLKSVTPSAAGRALHSLIVQHYR